MVAYVAVVVAFATGLALYLRGWRWWTALLLSGLVVPAFIAATVVLNLPGSEWWPVAIIFGTLYGVVAAGGGVLIARIVRRKREPVSPSSASPEGA